jgi:hypothetical protein
VTWKVAVSGKISTIGSVCFQSRCRRCATESPISMRCRNIFSGSPALKLRRTDVRLYLDDIKGLTAYDWPGNVRELQHVIERAVILGREAGYGLI